MEEYNRVSSFIQAFLRENNSLLEEIREEAQKDAVPIIRDETAALLRVCLEINKPKSILELGTAVGYSALLMLDCLSLRWRTFPRGYGKRRKTFKGAHTKSGFPFWKGMQGRF